MARRCGRSGVLRGTSSSASGHKGRPRPAAFRAHASRAAAPCWTDPGLVDEDPAPGVKLGLMRLPAGAPPRDVGSVLLGGVQDHALESSSPRDGRTATPRRSWCARRARSALRPASEASPPCRDPRRQPVALRRQPQRPLALHPLRRRAARRPQPLRPFYRRRHTHPEQRRRRPAAPPRNHRGRNPLPKIVRICSRHSRRPPVRQLQRITEPSAVESPAIQPLAIPVSATGRSSRGRLSSDRVL